MQYITKTPPVLMTDGVLSCKVIWCFNDASPNGDMMLCYA